jgi:Na+/serine symporter
MESPSQVMTWYWRLLLSLSLSHSGPRKKNIFRDIYSTSLIIFDVIFSFLMMEILGLFSAQYIEKIRFASEVRLSTWSNLGVGFLVQSIYLHCI